MGDLLRTFVYLTINSMESTEYSAQSISQPRFGFVCQGLLFLSRYLPAHPPSSISSPTPCPASSSSLHPSPLARVYLFF